MRRAGERIHRRTRLTKPTRLDSAAQRDAAAQARTLELERLTEATVGERVQRYLDRVRASSANGERLADEVGPKLLPKGAQALLILGQRYFVEPERVVRTLLLAWNERAYRHDLLAEMPLTDKKTGRRQPLRK